MLLEARNIEKSYGAFQVLRGVSVDVSAGRLHAVIGPNGAGKTTLFNVLTGRIKPNSGRVLVQGVDVTEQSDHRRVATGVGRSFQTTTLFQELTVRENIRLGASAVDAKSQYTFWRLRRQSDKFSDRADEVIEMLGLTGQAGIRISELSHAHQRLVEVAMAVAPSPVVILLDEPTSGMAVNHVPIMEELLLKLREHFGILMIEHNMRIAMGLADRVSVLVDGELLATGPPEQIQNDARVHAAYLGSKYAAT